MQSSISRLIISFFLILLLCLSIFSLLPNNYQPPGVLFALGIIGTWRYTWGGLHLLRSLFYRHIRFPTIKHKAKNYKDNCPIYCVIMSYQTDSIVFESVFRRLFEEAAQSLHPVTIIASVTNHDEQFRLEQLFQQYPSANNQLFTEPQSGLGKRPALASALRILQRQTVYNTEKGLTILMDGDSLIPKNCFAQLSPYFAADKRLGGLTVNNRAVIHSDDKQHKLLQHWYNLKHRQRHWLMGSMALSNCLLVLTGRFSVFRTNLVTQDSFIEQIRHDTIKHWLYGQIKFVTGEDKSSWLWLLKRRWKMLYLPDVTVTSFESPEDQSVFKQTIPLMRRWYGNMYRAGRKAINIGPYKMPLFTWWSLVDQFIAPWTTLSAPLLLILIGLQNQGFLPLLTLYFLWVLLTRTIYSLIIMGKDWHISMPFILYYNQIVGAIIKLHAAFRPQLQGWTGQKLPELNKLLRRKTSDAAIATGTQVIVSLAFVYLLNSMVVYYG